MKVNTDESRPGHVAGRRDGPRAPAGPGGALERAPQEGAGVEPLPCVEPAEV
jgi:hypothetical protein